MEDGVVPTEGIGMAGGSATGSPLSFLNAEWINTRVENITAKVNALLDRLIDDGLLGSGYFPFDTPITDEMLKKMTPEQFRALYDTMTTVEEKAALVARMKDTKLPPIELMPFPDKARYPTPKPVAGEERSPVSSEQIV